MSDDEQNNYAVQDTEEDQMPGPDQEELEEKRAKCFKITFIVELVLSAVITLVWFSLGGGIPWFVYVIGALGMAGSVHFWYFVKHQFLPLNISIYVIICILSFITWIARRHFTSVDPTILEFPWFIVPVFVLAVAPLTHYFLVNSKSELRMKVLKIHSMTYALMNILIFLIWCATGEFPWFFYPLFGWGFLLSFHYLHINHHKNWFFLHVNLFLWANPIIFFTWRFVGGGFPWFIFPTVVWTGLLGFHYYRYRNAAKRVEASDGIFSIPSRSFEKVFK